MTTEIAVGPELDALVAEKVMGLDRRLVEALLAFGPFKYSTTPDGCFAVLERMRELGWLVLADDEREGRRWCVELTQGVTYMWADGFGDTLPEAVARAALAAVGGGEHDS